MPKSAKRTRNRRNASPEQLYLHHLEEAAVHIGAAKQLIPDLTLNDDHLTPLEKIGRNLRALYLRAGGLNH